MTVRRHTDPINVKQIWDAIKQANPSRVTADVIKITKHFQNTDSTITTAQVEVFVNQALKDKLIIPNKKSDANHQTYKIPNQELPELDGKDWYCFECHRAGDVIVCGNCFRVYHSNCIDGAKRKFESEKKSNNYSRLSQNFNSSINTSTSTNQPVTIICDDSDDVMVADSAGNFPAAANISLVDKNNYQFDEKLCSMCNISRIDDFVLEKTEMNYMLRFVLHRIRAWLPNTITDTMAVEERPSWLTNAELTWRANQLFFEQIDMSVIEVKLNTETYNMFSEFLADVYTVHHNVALFHGIDSQEFGAAELMIRDAVHDIAEMKCCVDCYKHSNEKINNKWFCLPCRVPHQLVWAKQKGYPYWPAKVIKETSTHFDVRFFGGKYERANLLKNFIKPINIRMESLQIKASSYFNKAYEEMRYHQLLLNNPLELEKLLTLAKPKRRSNVTQQKTLISTPKTPKNKRLSKIKVSSKSKKGGPRGRLPKTKTKSPKKSINKPDVNNSVKSTNKRKSDTPVVAVAIEDTPEKKQKTSDQEHNSSETISGNVIDISDGEDEYQEYSFRETTAQESFNLDETYEQVSSSTENFGKQTPRRESGMLPLDQPYSDSVEKMRRQLECLANKKEIIKCAMDCMQLEIDKITNDHNDHLKRLFESHNQQISETKKKQWCYNCEQDAIYHCCWNTAYCSQTCQQQHWQAEHKKVCRRKRS